MTTTEADRLSYEPPRLKFSNGESAQLHFGYGGLRRIEKKYGSLQGLFAEFEKGEDGRIFDTLFTGLHIGLWKTGMTEDQLEELIDPADMEQHIDVLTEALTSAFPQQVQEMRKRAEGASEGPKESPGPTTTTSQQLSVVEPMPSSGT